MLKRIEIYGFKSFAEKTVLNFDSSLNGIVGPNGSGKSNIVDAIKWCLGEQALSEIRCKNMLDVIFGGSESKSPLNYCEVTVVFDNEKGTFPVDYNEVAVTRRIYRTGESEYYINRAPCRLKDIKELVLDTGLSSSGYAIIPQGKVEFVVSAKPEERRLLFEETAGVAKFKSRREESLRKLERVKQDMLRVDDILAHLTEEMGRLESAVKKAKNYQKYKEELQVLECANAVRQITELETKLEIDNKTFDELTQQYTTLAAEIANNEAQIVNLRIEITELEKQYIELKDNNATCETEISLTTQKIENYKKQIVDAENTITKLQTEIKDLEMNISDYEIQQKDLQIKYTEYKTKLDELHKQKLSHQQEYDSYRNLITEKQSLVKHKNKLVADIAYNRMRIQNEINNFTKKLHQENTELNVLKKDIETQQRDKNSFITEIEMVNKKLTKTINEKVVLEQQIKTVSDEIQNLNILIEQKKVTLENLNKEYYTLNSKLEDINNTISAQPYSLQKVVKYIESLNNPNIYGPIKSILRFSAENYALVTSYLGNKSYWFVAKTEQDAVSVIENLAKDNIGYATFIIEEKLNNSVENLTMEQKKLLSFVQYDSKWEKTVHFLFSDAGIENNILKTQVVVHGGDYISSGEEENLYDLENKVNKIVSQIQKNNTELHEMNNKLSSLVSQKSFSEKKVVDIETEITELNNLKLKKEENLVSLEELLNTLNLNLETRVDENNKLELTLNALHNDIQQLDEQEKLLRQEISSLTEEIEKLQSNQIVEQFLKISSDYSRLEEQVNNILNEINAKKELIKTNQSRITVVKIEINDTTSLIKTTKKNIVDEEQKLDNLLATRDQLQKKLDETNSIIEQKRTTNYDLENRNKELLNKKDVLQQQIKSSELNINTIANNKMNIENWVYEKYSISIDDAKSMYSNIEVDIQHLERLKKRIESMGVINLAAPEEYSVLEEKYNTLITQQQDLIKSEQDIKQAIKKINEQITTDFKDTFYKVKENFKNICGRILFEGGKADLVLTNEDDLLESGIEIIVQPPGKKLQSLSLLSGGEKSLVALGLLFAFFMVRPSPVCILDEADAQLDEANIIRFMKLLKEFTKSTKFVLITHTIRTMEFLETIYGVTMEELGVSKIISLKLQKEETEIVSA